MALAPAYFSFPVHLKIKRGGNWDVCAYAVSKLAQLLSATNAILAVQLLLYQLPCSVAV